MGIGEGLDFFFTLAAGLVLRNERVQTPGGEINLYIVLLFFEDTVRNDCVSSKWIPEHVCRARRWGVSRDRVRPCATSIVPWEIYAEVVDTFPGLLGKGRDATEVSKYGAFMSRAERFIWIGWVIVIL